MNTGFRGVLFFLSKQQHKTQMSQPCQCALPEKSRYRLDTALTFLKGWGRYFFCQNERNEI
jgi:hypothetical protein